MVEEEEPQEPEQPTVQTYVDELNVSFIGASSSTSYFDWSNKVGNSGAVYCGNTADNKGAYIQLRSSSNSGIVSTTSGGKVKKVVVTWNSTTTGDRKLDIYGKQTEYSSAADLYNNTNQGTKIGSIVFGENSELQIDGEYTYIGLRSNNGAMYFDKIEITWESDGTSGGAETPGSSESPSVDPTPTPDPTPGPGTDTPSASYSFESDPIFVLSADNGDFKAYTLGDTKFNGQKATGFKLGSSSSSGSFLSGEVGIEGEATLTFYAVGWNGKNCKLNVTIADGESNATIEGESIMPSGYTMTLTANSGANNTVPYTITVNDDTDYFSLKLTGLKKDSKLSFSTPSDASDKRAVVAGIHLTQD